MKSDIILLFLTILIFIFCSTAIAAPILPYEYDATGRTGIFIYNADVGDYVYSGEANISGNIIVEMDESTASFVQGMGTLPDWVIWGDIYYDLLIEGGYSVTGEGDCIGSGYNETNWLYTTDEGLGSFRRWSSTSSDYLAYPEYVNTGSADDVDFLMAVEWDAYHESIGAYDPLIIGVSTPEEGWVRFTYEIGDGVIALPIEIALSNGHPIPEPTSAILLASLCIGLVGLQKKSSNS